MLEGGWNEYLVPIQFTPKSPIMLNIMSLNPQGNSIKETQILFPIYRQGGSEELRDSQKTI